MLADSLSRLPERLLNVRHRACLIDHNGVIRCVGRNDERQQLLYIGIVILVSFSKIRHISVPFENSKSICCNNQLPTFVFVPPVSTVALIPNAQLSRALSIVYSGCFARTRYVGPPKSVESELVLPCDAIFLA